MDIFSGQRKLLERELPQYARREAEKCRSVGITLKYPVYSDLTADQLDFYTYWKGTVGTKDFKKTADGYVWLLVSELVNLTDKDTASERLNLLCTSVNKDGSPIYPELLKTAVEFSMLNGTPLPPYADWMAAAEGCGFLSRALKTPVSDIPPEALREYVPDIMFKARGEMPMARVIGTVLREYDEILKRDGSGLRERFLRIRKSCFLPFKEYAYYGRKIPLETLERVPDRDMMSSLANLLAELYVGKPGRQYEVPFRDELVTIFARVMESGELTESVDPFSKEHGVLSRRLGTTPTPKGPSRFYDPLTEESRNHMTVGDLLTYGNRRPEGPALFVPSGFDHPTFRDLGEKQIAYYLFWRDAFSKGIHLDTDNGYVNLYLTELINEERGLDAHRMMERLYEVYGKDNASLIGTTLMDHALANNDEFPHYHVCMGRYTVNTWIDGYIRGTNQTPLEKDILGMMRGGSMNARYVGDVIPLKPFSKALQRIFQQVISKKDPKLAFSAEVVSTSRSLYFGLDYLRGKKERKVRYINYLGASKFSKLVDKCAEYTITELDSLKLGRNEKRASFTFSGVNCASIIHEEMLVWWNLNNRPEPARICLDMQAVAEAEADLTEVTEMMRTEEEEVVETPVQTATSAEGSDPWEQLSATLSADEREYLRRCLSTPREGKAYLKILNTTTARIDDAINTKSLDTVGDTVIEDGIPVEDYADELRRIL
ncbi:MAG: TerB N-terminal domain-containing protein [archaeon]|nr:TerB N-terminal domain-containing protein [archaeon]